MEKFEDVWKDILNVASKETQIRTIVKGYVNEVLEVTLDSIAVENVESRNPRVLLKEDFKMVWEILVQSKEVSLKDIDPELRGKRAIILAIMSKLDYIKYSKYPLRLFLAEDTKVRF